MSTVDFYQNEEIEDVYDSILDRAKQALSNPEIEGTYLNSFYPTSSDGLLRVRDEISIIVQEAEGSEVSSAMVASSGDAVLLAISEGVRKIDVFDVSQIALAYTQLKLVAVKYLDYDDYISIFDMNHKLNENTVLTEGDIAKLKIPLETEGLVKLHDLMVNVLEIGALNLDYNKLVRYREVRTETSSMATPPAFSGDRKAFMHAKAQLKNNNVEASFKEIDAEYIVTEEDEIYDYIFLSNIGIEFESTVGYANWLLANDITKKVIFTGGFWYEDSGINPTRNIIKIDDQLTFRGKPLETNAAIKRVKSKYNYPITVVYTDGNHNIHGGGLVFEATRADNLNKKLWIESRLQRLQRFLGLEQ
ncbi:MAG: hypothetical protein Q9M91_03615 [Candidatus Dojkabacteria bacterium]|nr:hypothetical protein [Candidatus Dojkabacteria bacterium]MDQ7020906.1 hypothetical protein [Candidatus Dojkabacteria bacterium]